ncbi:MAG: hypothetical protein NC337_03950 [Roseburia sp.]|nr:hypothetical protein [Roseburia sp.]
MEQKYGNRGEIGNMMESRLKNIGLSCFWAALLIELIIVMVDKSAYTNPYESTLFRLTFLLFCIKAATTRYSAKEWGCILLLGAVAVISYLINERDEAVRAAVFVAACKDVDLKKMLKVILVVTFAGSVLLFALSAAGIFGAFSVTANFGRGPFPGIVETRYCFGMGHPNAFQVMLLMMSTVFIWLQGREIRPVVLLATGIANIAAYLFTDSNAGLLVMLAVITGVALLRYVKPLRESRTVYILGAAAVVAIVIFSAYGSHVGRETPFMYRLDGILNGRFQYAHIIEAARVENWTLFGNADNVEYFDQGFIRLFYWYGIIPAVAYIGANLFLIRQSYKAGDYSLLVIVVGYAVLSIMEAHLISVYLLRNYLLVWLGYYWYQPFREKQEFEGYFWQVKRLLGRNEI